jgi:hypothetical protein
VTSGAEDATSTGFPETEHMQLLLPADANFVSVARFAVGLLASRSEFTVEEVQDLQLAVDELYVSTGTSADGAMVACDLDRRQSQVSVTIRVIPDESEGLMSAPDDAQAELSQQLLAALVEQHGQGKDDRGRFVRWLRKSHVTE